MNNFELGRHIISRDGVDYFTVEGLNLFRKRYSYINTDGISEGVRVNELTGRLTVGALERYIVSRINQ